MRIKEASDIRNIGQGVIEMEHPNKLIDSFKGTFGLTGQDKEVSKSARDRYIRLASLAFVAWRFVPCTPRSNLQSSFLYLVASLLNF